MNGQNTVPLILSREPVPRGLFSLVNHVTPNVAVVYDDGSGNIASFAGGPPRRSPQSNIRYRFRSKVDISDHRRLARLSNSPLPAKGDAYYFETTVNVGFRVVEPEEIVRRNVTDALVVVYDFLLERFRPITRRHDIQDAKGAEEEINALFYQNPMKTPEGILVFRCVAQLAPDAAARSYLQTFVGKQREHELAVAAAMSEKEIAAMQQDARLAGEAKERAANASRPLDLRGVLESHLARHPDETAYALELLMRYEEARGSQRDTEDQRLIELARFMIERGLMQPVDLDRLRTDALSRVQEVTGRDRPASALVAAGADWDDDLPPALAGQLVHSQAQKPQGRTELEGLDRASGSRSAVRAEGALPVYLLIDESPADAGYIAVLNEGIGALGAALSDAPEAIAALRLTILGYAQDAVVRMPMTTIARDGYIPGFAARGPARLGTAFERLLELIPRDVQRLKARGLKVSRPTVYLLRAGPGADQDDGRAQRLQLTDRGAFKYAPNIVACGIGGADPSLMAALATAPQLAFCAPSTMPVAEAAQRFARFLAVGLARSGVAHARGEGDAVMERPAGFLRPDEIEGNG